MLEKKFTRRWIPSARKPLRQVYLDGLLKTGNLLVKALVLPVQPMVVALQVRVLLLQVVEPPEGVTEALHRLVQLPVLRLQILGLALDALRPSLCRTPEENGSFRKKILLVSIRFSTNLEEIHAPLELLVLPTERRHLQFQLVHLASINLPKDKDKDMKREARVSSLCQQASPQSNHPSGIHRMR